MLNAAFEKVDETTIDIFSDNVLAPIDTPSSHFFVKQEAFSRSRMAKTKRYVTPFHEFDILFTDLQRGDTEVHGAIDGPSVAIISEGSGKIKAGDTELAVTKGHVILVLAGQSLSFSAESDKLECFRCFAE